MDKAAFDSAVLEERPQDGGVCAHRLLQAIERARSEMLARSCRADFRFGDPEVLKASRNLDRLINLYYRL